MRCMDKLITKNKRVRFLSLLLAMSTIGTLASNEATAGGKIEDKLYFDLLFRHFNTSSVADAVALSSVLSATQLCPSGTHKLVVKANLSAVIAKLRKSKEVTGSNYILFPAIRWNNIDPKNKITPFEPDKAFFFLKQAYKISFDCYNADGKKIAINQKRNREIEASRLLFGSFLLNNLGIYTTSVLPTEKEVALITKGNLKRGTRTYAQVTVWGLDRDSIYDKTTQAVFSVGTPLGYGFLSNDNPQLVLRLSKSATLCFTEKKGTKIPSITAMFLSPNQIKKGKDYCLQFRQYNKPDKAVPLPKPRPKDLITIDPAKDPANN